MVHERLDQEENARDPLIIGLLVEKDSMSPFRLESGQPRASIGLNPTDKNSIGDAGLNPVAFFYLILRDDKFLRVGA